MWRIFLTVVHGPAIPGAREGLARLRQTLPKIAPTIRPIVEVNH